MRKFIEAAPAKRSQRCGPRQITKNGGIALTPKRTSRRAIVSGVTVMAQNKKLTNFRAHLNRNGHDGRRSSTQNHRITRLSNRQSNAKSY